MWSLRLGVRVGLVILQQGGKSRFLAWGSSQGDHLLVSSITTSGGRMSRLSSAFVGMGGVWLD